MAIKTAVLKQIPGAAQLCRMVEEIADEEILPRYHHATVQRKKDGSLVTDADLAVQRKISERLMIECPDIPLLGEEMEPGEQQVLVEGGSFWCLDPLDGTTNFSTGLPYFAISLALILNDRTVMGVVYDPVRRECFHAERGAGAWLNGEKLILENQPDNLRDTLAMIDLKRLSRQLVMDLVERKPYRSQRCFGAVALEWCWLAAGRAHLYLHGGQKLWDYAAGALIHAEAGGSLEIGVPDGKRGLNLQTKSVIGATDPELFREWKEWLERAD